MQKSKLLNSLQQCSKTELKRLDDFIQSPYFNKKKSILCLWHTLAALLGANPPKLGEKIILTKLSKQLNVGDDILKNRLSELSVLYTKFLAYQHLEQQKDFLDFCALERSFEQKDEAFFQFKSNQYRKALGKSSIGSKPLSFEFNFLKLRGEADIEFNRKVFPRDLIESIQRLEPYYLTEKLKLYNNLFSYQAYNQHYIPEDLKADCLSFIERVDIRSAPIITQLFFHGLLVQTQLNEPSFSFLYQNLSTLDNLASNDFKLLLRVCKNFCIIKINRGQQEYSNIYNELIQIQIDKGLYIDEWSYKNLILIYCRLNNTEKAIEFLETRKQDLPKEKRENAYKFNLASILNYQGKNDEAIQLLNQIEYTDLAYYRGAKYKLIKIFYELQAYESIFSILDSLRIHFIRNEGIIEENKQHFFSFIRITKKLIQLKIDEPAMPKATFRKKLQELHQTIQNTPELINQAWFLRETTTPLNN